MFIVRPFNSVEFSFENFKYMRSISIMKLRWYKRDFTKEKQLPGWIIKYSNCPSKRPFLLYATQIIIPFHDLRISANNDKVET